jgi:flagellar motility protein MotE (MotC chaperone)
MDDNLLKKLKSIFIVEGDKTQSSSAEAPVASSSTTASVPVQSAPPVAQVPVTSSAYDDKMMQVLLEAFARENIEGFDYFEFRQALHKLVDVNPDQTTRYKSAYALAQTMGADKDRILQSCTHYLNILKQEESKFTEALHARVSNEVEQRRAVLKNNQEAILQKEKQIQQLQQEIGSLKETIQKVESEIVNYESRIGETHKSFQSAYNLLASELNTDLENIKKYC